jgi:hypothetical protein
MNEEQLRSLQALLKVSRRSPSRIQRIESRREAQK